MMKVSRNALLAAALVLGTGTAVYAAEGQTAPTTPGTAQQQDMKAAPAPTTGSGAMKDPSTTKAADPQKKSMDDPKQYGKPDKH
jgi:hypothetical protein